MQDILLLFTATMLIALSLNFLYISEVMKDEERKRCSKKQ
jgi:hypothetical protein